MCVFVYSNAMRYRATFLCTHVSSYHRKHSQYTWKMCFQNVLETPPNSEQSKIRTFILLLQFLKYRHTKCKVKSDCVSVFFFSYVFELRRLFLCQKGIKIKIAKFIIMIAFFFFFFGTSSHNTNEKVSASLDANFSYSVVDGKYIQSELRFSFHSNTYHSTRFHYSHFEFEIWQRKANNEQKNEKYFKGWNNNMNMAIIIPPTKRDWKNYEL